MKKCLQVKQFTVCLFAALALPVAIKPSDAVDVPNRNPALEERAMREARAALAASQWRQAIDLLRVHVHAYADDADAHNLLGYSLRQLGHYIDAQAAYERALQLDPSHQGAHAYMGELMLTQGRRDRALFHLTQLEQICQGNCAEYMQLKNAIDRDDSKISPRRW